MNYLKLLQVKFLLLPSRVRLVLVASVIFLIALFAYYSLRPNPNGWEKISKIGITLPLRYKLHGIDVSHHNGKIEWRKVKKMQFSDEDLHLEFCFLKATEGMTHSDREFERNWEQLGKLGIKRGAYHFFIPWREPIGQAKNFINSVKLKKGDFAPVLDIEQNSLKADSQIIAEIETWLNIVEKHYGVKPIIYTNPNFYRKFIKGNFDGYPLWIADYSKETLKGYGSNLWFWQHNQKGWCEGVKGTVDYNVFLGSESDLEDLCL
ncbi:GH25 family lysozyme [Arcicella sp. LKC2W]|uniref:glycoside hydrolase family 25 protein n=1 Tax=Arcicella sp. LKC2W TaxID=2984198 RepID=UPI002B215F38|nr:GH25 family lysozyme [Arcicella sp. LKC2W]MEA5457720.1 GH25 family lysozyme [Arcicella sp. LKC2W]